MRFQRVTQAISSALFIGLLLAAAYPLWEGLPVDLFLRLDPLISVGTMLAAGSFILKLIPGLLVVGSAFIVGRAFCGHICPMGTTIDIGQAQITGQRKRLKRQSSYEAEGRRRNIKYFALLVILAAALTGVSLVHFGSPLSLATRFLRPLPVSDIGFDGGPSPRVDCRAAFSDRLCRSGVRKHPFEGVQRERLLRFACSGNCIAWVLEPEILV